MRPLAEVLTELPAFADDDGPRAAPTFELYGEVTLSPFREARWTLLLERLDALTEEAAALAAVHPRLGSVGQTLSFLRRRIADHVVRTPPVQTWDRVVDLAVREYRRAGA